MKMRERAINMIVNSTYEWASENELKVSMEEVRNNLAYYDEYIIDGSDAYEMTWAENWDINDEDVWEWIFQSMHHAIRFVRDVFGAEYCSKHLNNIAFYYATELNKFNTWTEEYVEFVKRR